MLKTPYHAYYSPRILSSLNGNDIFLTTFASSDIEVYLF